VSFTGTWRVVSSPDFDDDTLRMEVEPYIEIHQSGNRVTGEYHVGLQSGTLSGRLRGSDENIFSSPRQGLTAPANVADAVRSGPKRHGIGSGWGD
jgi:hypothetical protein